AHRAAAGLAVFVAKTGDEVDGVACRAAVFEGYEDHLVAHRVLAVPAAVLADEYAVGILLSHHFAGEVQAQRGDVGAEGVVRDDGAGDLVLILRFHPWVDVLAEVAVGPAVEAAFLDRGKVVGHQVLAQFVTLVDHRPQGAGVRLDGQGGGDAQAGGVGLVGSGFGVYLPDHGAVDFGLHAAFGDVAVGADADVQVAAVFADGQRLGPVVVDRRRQAGDLARRAAGPGLTVLVVEAHQLVLIGHVQVALVQGHTVGRVEVFGEHRLQLIAAVTIGVAQQGQAVAA